ncbi:MAG TPA: sugar phosphate isomerase/epimerase family protein [Phycisphaerae bacterium]|nr:sugar phosphate isomerase/epimerase family protein [Phycisphaerae bacterium]
MKLAFSTNAFKKTTLEAAINAIADIGYPGVEIMADVPHAYPPDMPPPRIQTVRNLITSRGMAVSNVNAFTLFARGDTYHPSWIEEDPARIRQRIEHTHNAIRMTAALGGKTISLQPGGPLGSVPREIALDRYEAGLRECLPLAQSLGITLMVEPEPGLLIQHSWECTDFLRRVNHPHLKMNCDLGHFYCVEEDPATVLRQCADVIAHVHLEDIKENRVHQHHIPGTGAMDWPGIFAALRAIGYPGWITIELYPYETTAADAARRAWDFLQQFR